MIASRIIGLRLHFVVMRIQGVDVCHEPCGRNVASSLSLLGVSVA